MIYVPRTNSTIKNSNLYKKQVDLCCQLLTDVGVPEWVMHSDSKGVPENSLYSRLKWYLMRRKDVSQEEIDHKLQREMNGFEKCELKITI